MVGRGHSLFASGTGAKENLQLTKPRFLRSGRGYEGDES